MFCVAKTFLIPSLVYDGSWLIYVVDCGCHIFRIFAGCRCCHVDIISLGHDSTGGLFSLFLNSTWSGIYAWYYSLSRHDNKLFRAFKIIWYYFSAMLERPVKLPSIYTSQTPLLKIIHNSHMSHGRVTYCQFCKSWYWQRRWNCFQAKSKSGTTGGLCRSVFIAIDQWLGPKRTPSIPHSAANSSNYPRLLDFLPSCTSVDPHSLNERPPCSWTTSLILSYPGPPRSVNSPSLSESRSIVFPYLFWWKTENRENITSPLSIWQRSTVGQSLILTWPFLSNIPLVSWLSMSCFLNMKVQQA